LIKKEVKKMKTYAVKFYPLEMIVEANSKNEAEELARRDIAIGESVLEVEFVEEIKENEIMKEGQKNGEKV
jgi:hypothetical protein